jgi:hypothetical protein
MRDFQDNPETKSTEYGLFLIKNPDLLTVDIFNKMIQSLKGYISALELVQKGDDKVLIGYFPHFLRAQYPLLGMIEIEDYILGRGQNHNDHFLLSKQISLDESFSWKLQPKKNQAASLEKKSFHIDLESDQYLAWQIVFDPTPEKIQITPRLIIKEKDPQKKIELIKKIKQQIDQHSSLSMGISLIHSGVYSDYKSRNLVPKQVNPFLINIESLLTFLS